MRTQAEREVADRRPGGVELIRLIGHRGVAMRGSQQQHHDVALGNSYLLLSDDHILSRDPADQLDRRVIAQSLLDNRRGSAGILPEGSPVPRMAKHGQHPVGDQIHRRLVSGDQQQIAGRDNLFLGELIAGLLDRNQPRHQVVARVCAALLQ